MKLDIEPVTQLMRDMTTSNSGLLACGVIGTEAYRRRSPDFCVGDGLISVLSRSGDGVVHAADGCPARRRDAGDADAVRKLRRLHWSGMLCNAALVAVLVTSIPYIATSV